MKASLYVNYTTRSLLRGGQRTILALFCIAVGVMAIVALQSVGEMIAHSFTGNVRDANGGDIAISSYAPDITQDDLTFFADLKKQGTITGYTPVLAENGALSATTAAVDRFALRAVDPQTYPVVTPPVFVSPGDGRVATLLKGNQVIVDQAFADQYHKNVGDRFDVHITTTGQGAIVLHAQLAGVVADSGVFANAKNVMLIDEAGIRAAAPTVVLNYSGVYVATADQAHTDQALSAIRKQFPLQNIQTVSDALKAQQMQIDLIKKFLEIAGMLALLIGGVGIVNTMQVLLSRRKVEIAMLKTVGYRRFDLYMLFGLEAGLLGVVGGIIGALAATGLSYLVLQIMMHLFQIAIPFQLDPQLLGGGVLIGLCTALIFGLLPIVQAANVRPLTVIRDLPGGRSAGSILLTIGLLLLLSLLFCLLSVFILNDVLLAIGLVYGTFIFLGLLSLFFVLVVWFIGILPVPERFHAWYLILVLSGILIAALITLVLPTFGFLLLVVALLGIVIVLLPRTWKANMKMALRNIGRQRARTTTTLLALFIGVFTIGLILVLGQNVRDLINTALANTLTFNVAAITRGNDGQVLHDNLSNVPGLKHTEMRPYTQVAPLSIDGASLKALLTTSSPGRTAYVPNGVAALLLSSVEGYDVAHNQVPDPATFTIVAGRNLTAGDAGSDNVLISSYLLQSRLKGTLKLGSTITMASLDRKSIRTVTVVGIYATTLSSDYGSVLTPAGTVQALTPAGQDVSVFYLKIDPNTIKQALTVIGKKTPNAAIINYANLGDYIDQVLNNILLMLVAIASLSLLAGIIIIANAVALAMLERRRELGILKSVGYTSQTVLSEVLVENGVIGGTGAVLAMLLVTLVTNLLGRFAFQESFGVSWYIVIGLIVGVALLAILTATLVAWGAVRVRPLEVLRYE